MEAIWEQLEAIWGQLQAIWEQLEAIWEQLGVAGGQSEAAGSHLEAQMADYTIIYYTKSQKRTNYQVNSTWYPQISRLSHYLHIKVHFLKTLENISFYTLLCDG